MSVTRCKLDKSLYFWYNNGRLEGILCIYVDDFLWAGVPEFQTNIIDKLGHKFLIGSSGSGTFTFLGLKIRSLPDGISLDQKEYINTIAPITLNKTRSMQKHSQLTKAERALFRTLVGQLNWIATNTRPDIAFDTCELSSVQNSTTIADVLKINKLVHFIQNESLELFFPRLHSIKDCTVGHLLWPLSSSIICCIFSLFVD